jgi:hypothetical protein
MPTSSEATLLLIERMSCFVAASKLTTPSDMLNRQSVPAK